MARPVKVAKKTKASNKGAKRNKVSPPILKGYKRALAFMFSFALIGVAVLLAVRAEGFDTKAFLQANTPGTLHEAIPHGVPAGYDWQSRSVLQNMTPPTSDSGYINMWGQIFVDQTNVRPANTRVAVTGCQMWGLNKISNTWVKLADAPPGDISGGVWAEDFHSNFDVPLDIRTETDGTQSMKSADGQVAHYWTNRPLVNAGTNYKAFMAGCSARLVLANPAGIDDRAQSTYIIDHGIDWRKSDYGCPTPPDSQVMICSAIGQGHMIKVKNYWRRSMFSTMSASELSTFPMPPLEAFLNPDGTYGDGTQITPPIPPPTPDPDPNPTPTPTPATLSLRGLINGQTAAGNITLEAVPDGVGNITQTQFFVDGALATTESLAPWCLKGDVNNICNPYDTKALVNGNHTFKAVMTHSGGTLEAQVIVNIQNIVAGGGNGLKVAYFSNKDFTGATVTGTTQGINYDWGTGSSQKKKIGVDTFSGRWTGKLQAEKSETYTITTLSDDGVRLYLNNQLIIDNWTDHSATTNTATINLVAGQKYDLKLEYFENTGSAVMKLFWSSPTTPQAIVPAAYLFQE